MITYLVPFLSAFMITLVVTPVVRRVAIKYGVMDQPDQRKVHTHLIPRMGGVAIFIGYVASLLASRMNFDQEGIALLVGTVLLVAVGLWDDITQIGPKTKLIGQIGAAAILACSGITIDFITMPGGTIIYFPLWVAIPLTVFWIVGFTNIVNLIDGLDGLAAGISFLACVTIFAVSFAIGQSDTAIMAAALGGAALAFLRYNFNPAKIFMGDTGSMLLGYTIGAMSVIGVVKAAAMTILIVPVLVLGVPILDTAFAIIRRYGNGRPIFKPDKGHIHHRLLAMGLTQKQAVLLMYGLTCLLGILSVIIAQVRIYVGIVLVALILLSAFYMARRIGVIGKNSSSTS